MGDTPVTTNPVLTQADTIVHTLLFEVAENAAIDAITAQLPFLKLPFFSQLLKMAMNYLTNIFYTYLKRLVIFNLVDSQVGGEVGQATQAQNDLKLALSKGDPGEIQIASDNFKNQLAKLIHYDGS